MAPRPGHGDAVGALPGGTTFTVDAGSAGQRLDVFLARAAGLPRSQVQRLIAGGHVRAEGRPARAAQPVRPGQTVTLSPPPPQLPAARPQALPLDILYEDEDLLVVNKPPGLVVHPAAGHPEGTLVNALLYHRPGLRAVGGEERPGIVHRLDKDTSGLLLVAKTPEAHAALSRQFADRTIEKRYLAIVHRIPAKDSGEIAAAVGRHTEDRKRMSVRTRKGREALTLYRVVERLGDFSLMELTPRTGRTHQLRVHLAHLGHPILGDPVYGGRRERARRREAKGERGNQMVPEVSRQMLHASRLAFRHPRTGDLVQVEAPLPPDFAGVLGSLRSSRS